VTMASPVLRPKRERFINQRSSNESAALRLIAAERPEEIFPILLEEIVFLGFPRAAVLDVDFDTGEIKPAASLNFDSSFLKDVQTSLWASEDPLVTALQNLKPVLLPDGKLRAGLSQPHAVLGSRTRAALRLSGAAEYRSQTQTADSAAGLFSLRHAFLYQHGGGPVGAQHH
jgi:hypothetical protein